MEEVLFLRDEMANLAWAIEQTVKGRSDESRATASEPQPSPDPWPDRLSPQELVYRLQTTVSAHWIPLVPIGLAPGRIALRKGALLRDDKPVEPAGVTLAPQPLTFPGEEILREGVHLRDLGGEKLAQHTEPDRDRRGHQAVTHAGLELLELLGGDTGQPVGQLRMVQIDKPDPGQQLQARLRHARSWQTSTRRWSSSSMLDRIRNPEPAPTGRPRRRTTASKFYGPPGNLR